MPVKTVFHWVLGGAIVLGSAGAVWSGLSALDFLRLDGAPATSARYEDQAIPAELPDPLRQDVDALSQAYSEVITSGPWGIDSVSRDRAKEVNRRIGDATHCLYQAFAEYRLRGGDTPLTAGIVSRRLERAMFAGSEEQKDYDAFNRAVSGSVWALPEGGVQCR